MFLEDGVERRIEASAGDYVYVPPYVPHREENPSPDEEAIVVLARTTQEGIVVNLSSPTNAIIATGQATGTIFNDSLSARNSLPRW